MKTTVSSDSVAVSIIQEVKRVAKSYDSNALEREKSLLISDVNHKLNDEQFYDHPVSEYRTYATIQTLLDDWRRSDPDIERLGLYESRLVEWLCNPKPESAGNIELTDISKGERRMLIRAMHNKLNEKYRGKLNPDQSTIVKIFASTTDRTTASALGKLLENVRQRTLGSMDSYVKMHSEAYECKKMEEAKQKIVSESLDNIDDGTVARFMQYAKLLEELESDS
jgi:hypothetical protein